MNERPFQSVVGTAGPPRAGDELFRADDDWQSNACVNQGLDPEVAYRSGYRTGAQHLARQLCLTAREQDLLVYPVVYLYRHHIELALKRLFVTASELLDKPIDNRTKGLLGKHGLSGVWKELRPLLDLVCDLANNPTLPEEDLEGIDSYVRQLDEHDPDGQSFRYATRRDGASSLKSELKLINVRVFAQALELLADYLDGIDGWFSDLLYLKREALHDARAS
jgi:hypothetical protein